MKDERIEQAKNKIGRELAVIILYCAALSFCIKVLVFHMELRDCITEYLILILSPLYQLIRMHMMKVSIYSKQGNKQSLKNLLKVIIVLGMTSALLIINSAKESAAYDWQKSAISITVFLLLFAVVYGVANKFNQHRGHLYEKEFDDDEN